MYTWSLLSSESKHIKLVNMPSSLVNTKSKIEGVWLGLKWVGSMIFKAHSRIMSKKSSRHGVSGPTSLIVKVSQSICKFPNYSI